MYATVRRAAFHPGTMSEVIQRVKDTFVPAVTTMPGYVDFYLVNLGNDVVSTMSIFETQAEAEAANSFFSSWAKRELTSFLQSPPELALGEIAIHTSTPNLR